MVSDAHLVIQEEFMWDLPAKVVRLWRLALVVVPTVFFAATTNVVLAQNPPLHYLQSADMPPGAIGRAQLLRGGPTPGYFQPVEVKVPKGTSVSLAVHGQYSDPQLEELHAGMLLGAVYRLRVYGLALQPEAEIYPTIEVISRLHPPPGQETRFPIPVHITEEEMEMAIGGRYVTRVIYLENPMNSPGVRDNKDFQRYFEVRPDQDPLKVADELGRPMAILRMGSRVPDANDNPTQLGYAYGTPPAIFYEKPKTIVPRDAGLERPAELYQNESAPRTRSQTGRFPRMPLTGENSPAAFNSKPQVLR
jgi:hypothetical protein